MRTKTVQLEHANITVRNVERAIDFLTTAFDDFSIRGGERVPGTDMWEWVHVGNNDTYIALQRATSLVKGEPYQGPGVNHLGFAVDDAEALRDRLLKAGYSEGFVPEPHKHRKRVYIYDADGLEWEFVQYYSDDPAERNSYA